MDEQIQQIVNNQKKQGERINIGNLRHKPKPKNKLDQETITRLHRLKRFALQDTSIPTQKLNNYYCSLCGRINLVTNVLLENLPFRQTDSAIAIELKSNFLKLNVEKDKKKYIKRESGLVETYYRWKCQCGMPIGYTAIPYEDVEQVRLNENFVSTNKLYFYVYQDALVEKMQESKLVSQLITYKETILLHLKRKTKK